MSNIVNVGISQSYSWVWKVQQIPTQFQQTYSQPQIDGKVNQHCMSRDLLFHLFGDDYRQDIHPNSPRFLLHRSGKSPGEPPEDHRALPHSWAAK